MGSFEPRPYQREAVAAVLREWDGGRRRTLLVLPTGCHAAGQKVLMANGLKRDVEHVHRGEFLMGPDGKPREVLALHHGESDLYRVVPVKGEPFIVTGDHMLTLVRTGIRSEEKAKSPSHRTGGMLVDVTVEEWLGWSDYKKHTHKLLRSSAIDKFHVCAADELEDRSIDPYFLGILLGDGSLKRSIGVTTMDREVEDELMRQAGKYGYKLKTEPAGKADTYYFLTGCIGVNGSRLHQQLKSYGLRGAGSADKFVPFAYKTAPYEVRLEVMAGLLDSDGSLSCGGYDFISKSKMLADDLAFMCRSCGLAAYVHRSAKKYGDFSGEYWRVFISGDCSIIPCRVAGKKAAGRRQKKNVLRTGFSIEPCGYGEYYGFTVDGDNRYLLDDFTITHNCGKTCCFSMVAKARVDEGDRVLVLAHRGELLDQAADKIAGITGLACSVEKAEQRCDEGWERVTVGSVQTMQREERLHRLPRDWFSTVIVDEAHHAAADGYRRVLDWFSDAKVLGVTATADRSDKKSLAEVFDSLAYEYSLPQAIKDGYLVPIKAQTVPLRIDLAGVAVQNGDFQAAALGTALDPYLEQIADEMLSHGCLERKTVVFLPLVATAKKFRAILEAHGFRAAEVDGESDDRAEVLADFADGKYDVLCNAMLLTEGWDCPSVDCIVVLRPTKVRSLYAQMVGRGTRLCEGKDHLLVLDFMWHTERHRLCRPASLVSRDEAVEAKAAQIMEGGAEVDVLELEREAERDVMEERERAAAEELARQRRKKARLVDVLQFETSIGDEDLSSYVPAFGWECGPATEKQAAAIEKWGLDPMAAATCGKAAKLLGRLDERARLGLSTPKQIRFLEARGFRHVGSWSKDEANRMIARISSNGWRVPKGVVPAEYEPERSA